MHIGLQIPSFKYPGGPAVIRPKLKEIVTTAEAGFGCTPGKITRPNGTGNRAFS